MKNIVLSAVAVIALGSFAVAGGDIAPVQEPVVEVPEVASWSPTFYVGAAYVMVDGEVDGLTPNTIDVEANNYAVAAGMVLTPWLAVEGRYSNSMDDLEIDGEAIDGGEAEVAAIFLKPMYAIADTGLVAYGLLGYANVSIDDDLGNYMDDDGLAYGVGAAYAVTPNVLVFADWTRLYDDTVEDSSAGLDSADVVVDTINVGAAYIF
jgi:opacity protein-like surface antigen